MDIDRKGIVFSLSAYLFWGFVPLYFKAVSHVTPLEVLAHRVVWAALFLAALLFLQRRLGKTVKLLTRPRTVWAMLGCTALVLLNWFSFIYAIGAGKTLEASFGYFILPLFSIAIGFTVLKERLTKTQFTAMFLATLGVLYQLVIMGKLPWIALTLAVTFSL